MPCNIMHKSSHQSSLLNCRKSENLSENTVELLTWTFGNGWSM